MKSELWSPAFFGGAVFDRPKGDGLKHGVIALCVILVLSAITVTVWRLPVSDGYQTGRITAMEIRRGFSAMSKMHITLANGAVHAIQMRALDPAAKIKDQVCIQLMHNWATGSPSIQLAPPTRCRTAS